MPIEENPDIQQSEAKKTITHGIDCPKTEALTEEILKLFSVRTPATLEQVYALYPVIGPDWIRLAEACKRLSQGFDFNCIYNMAVLGEL